MTAFVVPVSFPDCFPFRFRSFRVFWFYVSTCFHVSNPHGLSHRRDAASNLGLDLRTSDPGEATLVNQVGEPFNYFEKRLGYWFHCSFCWHVCLIFLKKHLVGAISVANFGALPFGSILNPNIQTKHTWFSTGVNTGPNMWSDMCSKPLRRAAEPQVYHLELVSRDAKARFEHCYITVWIQRNCKDRLANLSEKPPLAVICISSKVRQLGSFSDLQNCCSSCSCLFEFRSSSDGTFQWLLGQARRVGLGAQWWACSLDVDVVNDSGDRTPKPLSSVTCSVVKNYQHACIVWTEIRKQQKISLDLKFECVSFLCGVFFACSGLTTCFVKLSGLQSWNSVFKGPGSSMKPSELVSKVQKVRHAQTMGYRPCIVWMSCTWLIQVWSSQDFEFWPIEVRLEKTADRGPWTITKSRKQRFWNLSVSGFLEPGWANELPAESCCRLRVLQACSYPGLWYIWFARIIFLQFQIREFRKFRKLKFAKYILGSHQFIPSIPWKEDLIYDWNKKKWLLFII